MQNKNNNKAPTRATVASVLEQENSYYVINIIPEKYFPLRETRKNICALTQ